MVYAERREHREGEREGDMLWSAGQGRPHTGYICAETIGQREQVPWVSREEAFTAGSLILQGKASKEKARSQKK